MKENLNEREMRSFIKKINTDPDALKRFIAKVSLTFGFKYSTISNLFRYPLFDVDKLLREGFKEDNMNNARIKDAIDKLFYWSFKDQDAALKEYNDYINALYQAYYNKDLKKIKELVDFINDIPFYQFKENRKDNSPLTNEDIITILRFELKYFYTPVELCAFLNISVKEYTEGIEKIKDIEPALYNYYHKLIKELRHNENAIEKVSVLNGYDRINKERHAR